MARPSAPSSGNTYPEPPFLHSLPRRCETFAPTLNVGTYICSVTIEEHLHQDRFASEGQKLLMHIHVIARQLELLTRRFLAPHGLTPHQYNALRILRGQKGQALAVQSLAERMIHPASNASRLIDKLQDKGWVLRIQCPEDRRRAEVSITPSGTAVLTALDGLVPPMLESTLSGIDETEVGRLNHALAGLLDQCDHLNDRYQPQYTTPTS